MSEEEGKWEYLEIGSQSSHIQVEGLGFEPRCLTNSKGSILEKIIIFPSSPPLPPPPPPPPPY